jgi:3-methyladenine DNA glycosylase/8-oxoguanine DNA glycosylase
VTVDFPEPAAMPEIERRLRRMFDLDAVPEVINAQLSQDPLMAQLVAARPGLRVPGTWDGLELAIRAVLGQQITVVAAIRLAGKLVAQYGQPCKPRTPILPTCFLHLKCWQPQTWRPWACRKGAGPYVVWCGPGAIG